MISFCHTLIKQLSSNLNPRKGATHQQGQWSTPLHHTLTETLTATNYSNIYWKSTLMLESTLCVVNFRGIVYTTTMYVYEYLGNKREVKSLRCP